MPISRGHTRSHSAYQTLRARILSGDFEAATPFRETEVADMLALGRTPVREALKRLEDEGLLVQEPRRGLVVRSYDQQAVIELYAMREVLEGAAVRFAARHATAADLACMDAALAAAGGASDAVKRNHAFHQAIYCAARNRFLISTLNALTDSTYLLGRSTLADAGRAALADAEHAAIVTAIRSGDAGCAEEAMRAHIGNALLARLQMLRTP